MLTGPASKRPGQSYVAGVKSVSSGFLSLTVPGISNVDNPDRLPLLVACEILTTLEGLEFYFFFINYYFYFFFFFFFLLGCSSHFYLLKVPYG